MERGYFLLQADCTDKSDEEPTFCQDFKKKHHCGDSEDMFYCHDDKNSCIANRWVCNGEVDCPNGFDENFQVCNRTTILSTVPLSCDEGFKCRGNNSACLSWDQVCNRSAECPEGDDENAEECSKATCADLHCTDQHRCQPTPDGRGRCICKDGYKQVNGSTCIDIDECNSDTPPCSQVS